MPDQEIIHLPSAGSIPGFPGLHGPGRYLIDKVERTIARLEDVAPEDVALRILLSSVGSGAVARVIEELAHAPDAPQAPPDAPAAEPAPEPAALPEATPAPAEAQPEPPAAAEEAQPDPSEPAPDEAHE